MTESAKGLRRLIALVEECFPLPVRFRRGLPKDTAELSRLLTSEQPLRDGGYLGRPNLLSAYLRYFLPWNVFRLCRLFSAFTTNAGGSGMDGSGIVPDLAGGDAVTDLGSGPLTLPIALWIARPELRSRPIEFRCIDHTGAVLEAGKKLFTALAASSLEPAAWTIKTIRGPLGVPIRGKKAKLVCAVNVFNELYRTENFHTSAGRAAALVLPLCAEDGSIFTAEPGNPRGGAFIAAFRSALLERGKPPLAPCTHGASCPLPGMGQKGRIKAKWCHFAFDTEDAPEALQKLSAAAGIPKERAVVSFLLAGPAGAGKSAGKCSLDVHKSNTKNMRVISDPFPVQASGPGKGWGRYGCSEAGLVLVTGRRDQLLGAVSGTFLELPLSGKRDTKTGALIVEMPEKSLNAGTAK